MATLRAQNGALHPISARLLIGRSTSCALRLTEPLVSGEHAAIVWTGGAWELRDLGSKNGTWLDGQRLETGGSAILYAGARIGFGKPDGFELVDASEPGAIAIDVKSGEVRAARDGLLVLASEAAPELAIFRNTGGTWVVESADQMTPIEDQAILATRERTFRIHLPIVLDGTPMADGAPTLKTVSLRFAFSRDEETVELTLIHRGVETKLETHDHNYVLLTLARVRGSDADLPISERGWIDREELLKMLSMEGNAVNVAIHRARRQLARAGIEDAAGIIETRGKQRRFGSDRFQIVPL